MQAPQNSDTPRNTTTPTFVRVPHFILVYVWVGLMAPLLHIRIFILLLF